MSDAGPIAAGTWVELDVTSIVRGNGTFGFRLYPTSSNGVEFESLQGAHPPQLIVQTVPAT